MNEKYQFIIPAVILVVVVSVVAAYGFIQAQYGLGPGGTLSVTSASVTGNTALGDESTDVVTIKGSITATGGALLNSLGATTGLRVEDGNSNAVLLVEKTGNVAVSGTISAAEMKIGTQNVCLADGTNCLAAPASASHGKQRFTANGTFTVPAGVTKVWVSMSGGGGGGGGEGEGGVGGGGGGAHAVIAEEVTVTSGSNITVTVGTGGTRGTSNTACGNAGGPGSAGGSSLFGSYISTSGGGGGGGGSMSGCGSYAGSNGIVGTAGGSGGGNGVGNRGGFSIFGGGGDYLKNGNGYGGGGGGSSSNVGGTGAPGFVLVEW